MKFARAFVATAALFALSGGAALAVEPAPAPSGVKLDKHGHGWIITGDNGMTLYTTILDQNPGKSACNGPCAKQWPPFAAADDAKPVGDFSVIARNDGAKQWAYRGKPLYAFSGDTVPGNTYGDEVGQQWNTAVMSIPTPSGVTITKTVIGHVLADAKGLTLYTYDKDSTGKSACDAKCARTWMPVIAPAMAAAKGDWSLAARADGTRQWAYQGKPVYRYVTDVRPTDTRGEGVDPKWHPAVVEQPPARPSWVTVQGADAGELFATAEGRTMYTRNVRGNGGGQLRGGPNAPNCGDECPGSPWQPVFAKPEDKPVGNWSIVDRPDGGKQWAFRGQPIYTHALDKAPGEIRGIRTGDGRLFGTLMRNGQSMPGTGV